MPGSALRSVIGQIKEGQGFAVKQPNESSLVMSGLRERLPTQLFDGDALDSNAIARELA
jgi:hypothetical protein